jgi:hypothetical protein
MAEATLNRAGLGIDFRARWTTPCFTLVIYGLASLIIERVPSSSQFRSPTRDDLLSATPQDTLEAAAGKVEAWPFNGITPNTGHIEGFVGAGVTSIAPTLASSRALRVTPGLRVKNQAITLGFFTVAAIFNQQRRFGSNLQLKRDLVEALSKHQTASRMFRAQPSA